MKRLLMILGGMCISIVMASAGDRTHDKDSIAGSFGFNLGLGFDANGDYSKTPFVLDLGIIGMDMCFPNHFLFGFGTGLSMMWMNETDRDFKQKYYRNIMRTYAHVGFSIGDYDDFYFKIGPTWDYLMGSKSTLIYGREQYVTTLLDIDDDLYKESAWGLRVGVGICKWVEICYQVGLTKHFQDDPTIHQITVSLPLRIFSQFPKID